MKLRQLKLLAGRIRSVLEQRGVVVNHRKGLDLSGALVGLRDWPEVLSLPTRVTTAELDIAGATRLAHRLQRMHGLSLTPEELLVALRPPGDLQSDGLPQIWPTGPQPGVYITLEPANINALIAAYDEASDGALIYAERAGSHWGACIDLGEDGLWSKSLEGVPKGTLLVLGPLDLNQQSWDDAVGRLKMACRRAQVDGHRVAVLLATESPLTLFHDVDLMVRTGDPEGDDTHASLLGTVSETGEMVVRSPFVEQLHAPVLLSSEAPLYPIPVGALPLLRVALANRPTGLLMLGSQEVREHRAVELMNAVMPLSDFAGPAARIRSCQRSTLSKAWDVPAAVRALPFLPSIESAYALGYRRMLIDSACTDAKLIQRYAGEVLFISGGYGGAVEDVFLSGARYRARGNLDELLHSVVAILAVTPLKTARADALLADMYVPGAPPPNFADKFFAVLDWVRGNRCLMMEDELDRVIDDKQVSASALKKALPRSKQVSELLSKRVKRGAPRAGRA